MITKKHYTLVELVAVIVILLILAAATVIRFRRTPAFISLDRQISEIKNLCAKARNIACCQGRTAIIILQLPEKTLDIAVENSPDQKFTPLEISEDIELKIENRQLDLFNQGKFELFKFFPDGSAMAQKLYLKLRKQQMRLDVSGLSGCLWAYEIKNPL